MSDTYGIPSASATSIVETPVPGLAVYRGTRERAGALRGLLQSLSDAQDRALQQPALWEIDVAIKERDAWEIVELYRPYREGPIWTGVYPVAPDFSDCVSALRLQDEPEIQGAPGATLIVSSRAGHEEVGSLWYTYQRATGGNPKIPHLARSEVRIALFQTRGLNPQADPCRDTLLAQYLETFVGANVLAAPGVGLMCAEGHAVQVQQMLSEPRLIRLAWDLSTCSPAERASIRRGALCDDDPLIAQFAALDLGSVPQEEFEAAHLDQFLQLASTDVGMCRAEPLTRIFQRLTARDCSRELCGLARTTVDGDQLSTLVGSLLVDKSPEKRRAAQAVFLERLPQGALGGFWIILTWSATEESAFFCALADRLRTEFWEGDASRACYILTQAVDRFDDTFDPTPIEPPSCLWELAGQVLFDERLGPAFRLRAGSSVLQLAARDRLHDSDPEIRRQACLLLKNAGIPLPASCAGDPFVADLFRSESSEADDKKTSK